jgi:hypothetical protein
MRPVSTHSRPVPRYAAPDAARNYRQRNPPAPPAGAANGCTHFHAERPRSLAFSPSVSLSLYGAAKFWCHPRHSSTSERSYSPGGASSPSEATRTKRTLSPALGRVARVFLRLPPPAVAATGATALLLRSAGSTEPRDARERLIHVSCACCLLPNADVCCMCPPRVRLELACCMFHSPAT